MASEPPTDTGFTAVPLQGLAAVDPLPFALYLRTAAETWILFHQADTRLDEAQLGRLQADGIAQLFLRDGDRPAYFRRVEPSLDRVLRDRRMPIDRRAEVLHGVAAAVAEQLLAGPPDRATVGRARRVMMAVAGLMLRDDRAFGAVRRVLDAGPGLARHGLTVGFLCMGLARQAFGSDVAALAVAGLGGLLHDVGRVGRESDGPDPAHTTRGATLLRDLGLPDAIVDVARCHHERHDGSGHPLGLAGGEIPELARIVGLVDAFEHLYREQEPPAGVFAALRALAQQQSGCFDPQLARGLVGLFR
jgi:putative nucleotidyltransferase with HDIG domain